MPGLPRLQTAFKEEEHLIARFVPLATILAAMLVLNLFAPLMADDFCYAASSLSDVWTRAVDEYFNWNGRFPAHFFGPLFTLAPGWVFDIANTTVCGLLLVLMAILARGPRPHRNDLAWLPVLAFFFLWFGVADFGQALLWQMGSANYLWTTAIVLAFLVPYRLLIGGFDLFERRKALSIAFPAYAVVSGWTNENTAATAWLLAAVVVVFNRRRGGRTPVWAVSGLIGHAVGLTAMVMSPGHHVRLASPIFQAWGDLSWLTRLIRFAPNVATSFASSWIVWIAVLGGAVVLHRHRRHINRPERVDAFVALSFVCAAVINNMVLVLAPMAPLRALTGGAVYLSVAAMILVLHATPFVTRRRLGVAAVCGLFLLAASVSRVALEYHSLDRMVRERQSEISAARKAGSTVLELQPIVVPRSAHMYWGSITDITYTPDQWANMCFARFIGFDSVRLVTPFEDGSTIPLGPGSPDVFNDGVTIEEVGYSPEHACLSVVLSSPEPGLIEGSFLDVRVLSDASPWHRRVMDRLRRRWFPATTAETFEYPHSRLRKIAVFSSFNIHSIFLDDQSIVNAGDRLVVFVPLTENARTITTLLIGKRRAHDATMQMHRIQ